MLHPEPAAREGAADGMLLWQTPSRRRNQYGVRAGPRPDRLDNREAGVDSLPNVSRPALQEAQVPLVRVGGQPFEALVGRTDRLGPSCLRGPPWFPKAMRGRSSP